MVIGKMKNKGERDRERKRWLVGGRKYEEKEDI